MASAPEYYAPASERIAELVDIRRAASLEDIRVDVAVAHTNQRLRARFCVSLRRPHNRTWAFGVEIKEVKQFEAQLAHMAKAHKGSKCSCRGTHLADGSPRREGACAMCALLRRDLKQWPKFSPFSTVGKRHLDTKCRMLTQFFYRLFRVVSLNAQWVQTCDLLQEMLRMTEALCRMQYDDDGTAVGVIKSLKRVTPVICESSSLQANRGGEGECSICLSSLHEPAQATTLAAVETQQSNQLTSQPTQGVELPCGHRFHDSCICMWFHTRLNCPVCRQTVTPVHENTEE